MTRPMRPSRTPKILDALVAVADTTTPTVTPAGQVIPVLDGPDSDDIDLNRSYLLIGWTGDLDTLGVQIEAGTAGSGGRNPEDLDVHGHVSIASGDRGQKTVRDLAFLVLDAFDAGIKQDATLGRLCSRAVLHANGIEPAVGDGAICTVPFTIHIEGTR